MTHWHYRCAELKHIIPAMNAIWSGFIPCLLLFLSFIWFIYKIQLVNFCAHIFYFWWPKAAYFFVHWLVVHCSTRRQNLFHLWRLGAEPDARASAARWAPAEGEGRFARCGQDSEGRWCHPAGDNTHTGLGMKKQTGPGKSMTICYSCHANLKKRLTLQHEGARNLLRKWL